MTNAYDDKRYDEFLTETELDRRLSGDRGEPKAHRSQ